MSRSAHGDRKRNVGPLAVAAKAEANFKRLFDREKIRATRRSRTTAYALDGRLNKAGRLRRNGAF
jgi:hypothetical protein